MSLSFILGLRSSKGRLLTCLLFLAALPLAAQDQERYHRTNLVSDIAGVALRTDPNLVNAWGIAFSPTSPIWIADNGTGVATIYQADGQAFPVGSPLVVTIPPPAGGTPPAAPTGTVFNGTPGFVVTENGHSGPSLFIFVTEDGTISGWSPGVDLQNAILAVDNSAPGGVDNSTLGAVYKGLAIAHEGSQTFLYATNFRDAIVEKYDSNFKLVKKFTDTNVPAGFAPFGIREIHGRLFVTFALQNDKKHDDVAGPGNGFVEILEADGSFQHFASQGTLNSPWGLAESPRNFGKFSDAIIVGDFGDGRINAFAENGTFLGQLHDELGQTMTINGLWGLTFGNGALAGKRNHLLFTAGIGDEGHGLFGVIRKARPDDAEDEQE